MVCLLHPFFLRSNVFAVETNGFSPVFQLSQTNFRLLISRFPILTSTSSNCGTYCRNLRLFWYFCSIVADTESNRKECYLFDIIICSAILVFCNDNSKDLMFQHVQQNI